LHYPPVKIEGRRPRNPRYLSEDERVMIADLLAVGDGVRAIARKLGRAASTISREIRRNRDRDERYRPHHAEQAARARALKPRKRRLAIDAVLAEAVGVVSCLASVGVRSRSRTSCGSCSASRRDGCVPSRSTRRSMTRRSR